MNISSDTKKKLIEQLESIYGRNYKTPLAKALGVNVSTVRRLFNEKEEIPKSYLLAIQAIIETAV